MDAEKNLTMNSIMETIYDDVEKIPAFKGKTSDGA